MKINVLFMSLVVLTLSACNWGHGEIEFYGLETLNHPKGHAIDLKEGVYAFDESGNDLSEYITVQDSVDEANLGEYDVTYAVEKDGDVLKEVTRTVFVRDVAEGTYDFSSIDTSMRESILLSLEENLFDTMRGRLPVSNSASGAYMFAQRLNLPIDKALATLGYGLMYGDFMVGQSQFPFGEPNEDYERVTNLRRGILQAPANLNPWDYDDDSHDDIFRLTHDTLYRLSIDMSKEQEIVMPSIAKDTPKLMDQTQDINGNDVATVFNIPLRSDVVFASNDDENGVDNATIDAYTFERTFKNALRDKRALASDVFEDTIEGASDYMEKETYDGFLDWETVGIEALDSETLQITFEEHKRVHEVKTLLANPKLAPMPPEQDALNFPAQAETFVSSGPYVPFYYGSEGIGIQKNTRYHSRDDYHFTHHSFEIFEDQYAMNVAFENGRIHAMTIEMMYDELLGDPRVYPKTKDQTLNITYNAHTQSSFSEYNPQSDFSVEPIMRYEAFQKGLYHSLDRQSIVEEYGDFHTPKHNFIGAYFYTAPGDSRDIYHDSQPAHNLRDEFGGFDLNRGEHYFKQAFRMALSDGVYEDGETITFDVYSDNASIYEPHFLNHVSSVIDDVDVSLDVEFNIITSEDMDGSMDAAFIESAAYDMMPITNYGCHAERIQCTFDYTKYPDTSPHGHVYDEPDALITYEQNGVMVEKMWSLKALYEAFEGEVILESGYIQ